MKKLLYILFAVTLFTACSSDDTIDPNGGEGSSQTKTSFVIEQNFWSPSLPNTITAYRTDSLFTRIALYGNLQEGTTSKEVFVPNDNITEVYVFFSSSELGDYRINKSFKLEKNKKNIIILDKTMGIKTVNGNDRTQYPTM